MSTKYLIRQRMSIQMLVIPYYDFHIFWESPAFLSSSPPFPRTLAPPLLKYKYHLRIRLPNMGRLKMSRQIRGRCSTSGTGIFLYFILFLYFIPSISIPIHIFLSLCVSKRKVARVDAIPTAKRACRADKPFDFPTFPCPVP